MPSIRNCLMPGADPDPADVTGRHAFACVRHEFAAGCVDLYNMKLFEPDRERREDKRVGPTIEIRSAEIARFQLRLAESAEQTKPDRRKKAVRVFGFAGREPPMTIRDWQLLAET